MTTHAAIADVTGTRPWGAPYTIVACSCGTSTTVDAADSIAYQEAQRAIAAHVAWANGPTHPNGD